jgi:hypothetical protein
MSLEVVTFVFGAILFAAALIGGGFKLGGNVEVPKITSGMRIAAGLVGVFFLAVAFWWEGRQAMPVAALPDGGTTPTTAPPTDTPTLTLTPTHTHTPLPPTETPVLSTATPEIPTATFTPAPLVGPLSGELKHDTSNSYSEARYFQTSVRNFVFEGTFFNPFSHQTNLWSFGAGFRYSGGQFYLIRVDSAGNWGYYFYTDQTTWNTIGYGVTDVLNLGEGESNQLKLVAYANDGCLYLNGRLIAELDLSLITQPGDVFIDVGGREGSEVDGAVTRYENIVINRTEMLDCR